MAVIVETMFSFSEFSSLMGFKSLACFAWGRLDSVAKLVAEPVDARFLLVDPGGRPLLSGARNNNLVV